MTTRVKCTCHEVGALVDRSCVDERQWAAILLASDRRVCRSIAAGRPVLASQLDRVVLRRALRGAPLPSPAAYIVISREQLDAIAEAGPITITTAGTRRSR